jgi:urease accessory protein
VSDVSSPDAVLLARAAYHLGNRHVPLQIERGALRYQHDHVLDEMVAALGLQVTPRTAAFEPEGGAYVGGHSHSHSHSHGNGHGHSHSHSHDDGHGRSHGQ